MHTLKLPPKEELTAIFLPGRKATAEIAASLHERFNIEVKTDSFIFPVCIRKLYNKDQPVRLINDSGQGIISSTRPMIPEL
jgi:hypothetical protein